MDNKRFFTKLIMGVRIYFVVIAMFAIATIIAGQYYVATGEIIVAAALSVYYITNKKTKQQQIASYIENLTFHLDNATKDSMINFPLPMMVLSLSGTVMWCNRKFSDIVQANAIEQPIQAVVPDVQILKILENKNDISIFVDHNDKYYQVVGNVVEFMDKQAKNYSIVLYWIDRTLERENLKKFENVQAISCVLMVDNYEELLKNTPDTEHAHLSATIEQMINGWVSGICGVARKYEKDKYYVIFQNQNLDEAIEKKFDILDKVHEISVGNKIPVTLSIGIGKGDSICKSDAFARASVDMALGRGGDQVVIKDSEHFRFFGGHSESFEKNTKVKPRVVAYALRELIDQASEVFIMGHRNADADSMGASIGLCRMVLNRGVRPYIVSSPIHGVAKGLLNSVENDEGYKELVISEAQALQMYSDNSLLIVVDTHNPSYTESPKLLNLIEDIVLIDHHRRGTEFIDDAVLTYHEPYASSASEMVTEIIQYMDENPKISASEAQALYSGITLDTKNFTLKTGVRTFEAASFLRRMGVDTTAVKRIFQNDIGTYIKKARIVSNAEIYKEIIAISVWNEEEQQANLITSQAADELLNISGITASFVLCKNDDKVIISGRSLGNFNVQIVLEILGGGGHMTVAGAQLQGISMNRAVEMLKNAIDKVEE